MEITLNNKGSQILLENQVYLEEIGGMSFWGNIYSLRKEAPTSFQEEGRSKWPCSFGWVVLKGATTLIWYLRNDKIWPKGHRTEGMELWWDWLLHCSNFQISAHEEGTREANFICWFKKMFLKQVHHLVKDGPVILFVDGHHSQITLELIKLSKDNRIHLMCLPPNPTHILQPLNVTAFHPLKQAYFKILKESISLKRWLKMSTSLFFLHCWESSFLRSQSPYI